MLSVFTDTPGVTAPIQANILPPTFQASCPPPQGSDTLAPGKPRQMALTLLRLMASPTICAVRFLPGPAHSRSQAMLLHQLDGRTASHATSATAEKGAARAIGPSGYPLGRERKDQRTRRRNAWVALGSTSQRAANVAG